MRLFFALEWNGHLSKGTLPPKKLLASGTLSPVISDFVYNGEVPKACAHFCGRDQELSTLHELISENQFIFLQGIAGIGKSELAKAYAKTYRKEYTNIKF